MALFVACLCILLTYVVVQKRGGKLSLQRLDLDKLPSPPSSWPFGHLGLLAPNFHRVLSGWANDLGTMYRIKIFGMDGVIVSDPVLVGKILGHDHGLRELPKHAVIYQTLDQVRPHSSSQHELTDF